MFNGSLTDMDATEQEEFILNVTLYLEGKGANVTNVTLEDGSIVATATVSQDTDVDAVEESVQEDVENGLSFGSFEVESVNVVTTTTTTPEGCIDGVDSINFEQTGQTLYGQQDNDELGFSIDFSYDGRRLAVGVPSHTNYGYHPPGYGRVEIYDYDDTNWNQLNIIYGEGLGSLFGSSLALNDAGIRIVVGSPKENYDGNENVGSVTVYQFTDTGFSAQLGQKLYGNLTYSQGHCVAISGSGHRIATGALSEDESGLYRVYELSESQWIQIGQTIVAKTSFSSISMTPDGNTIVVGGTDYTQYGYNYGRARVFTYSEDVWTQVGQSLFGYGTGLFGIEVDISSNGSIICVSDPLSDDKAEPTWGGSQDDEAGTVYIYKFNGSAWEQIGSNIVGREALNLAGLVSAKITSNGERVVIASPLYRSNGPVTQGYLAGHLRIFDWNGTDWEETIDITGSCMDDLGSVASVSSDGSKIAFGAPFNDQNGTNAGNLRVFTDTSIITTTTTAESDTAPKERDIELTRYLIIGITTGVLLIGVVLSCI